MSVGRRLTELRRSSAAGFHGKKSPDRYNTNRQVMEAAMDEDRYVDFDEEEYEHTGLVNWEDVLRNG